MWQYLGWLNTEHAALFRMNCKSLIVNIEATARNELQESTHEIYCARV